ncbi:MAG: MOSC domain-containing protein [Pseudomonadota bacterium]
METTTAPGDMAETGTAATAPSAVALPHRGMAELQAAMPQILAAPKQDGRLDLITVRPAVGARQTPSSVRLTLAGGVEGDHWAKGCWRKTDDGAPHPDVQICLMMSRVIRAIAGGPEDWAPAGDNLFIDMDLTPANTPPGTRLAIGDVELVVTEEPHNGCQKFIERYGRAACLFVNTGAGRRHRLRGIYCRVTRDGTVSAGDTVRKLG